MIASKGRIIRELLAIDYRRHDDLNFHTSVLWKCDDGLYKGILIIDALRIGDITENGIATLKRKMRYKLPFVADENILIVLIGNPGRMKFRGKNLVFISYGTSHIKTRNVDDTFFYETKILKSYSNEQLLAAQIKEGLYTKEKYYVAWSVYLIFALNIIAYVRTLIDGVHDYSLGINNSEVYRYVSYMFMHGNLKHLLGNMAMLLYLGRTLCKRIGNIKLIVVYLFGGVYGGAMSVATMEISENYGMTTVGASGAIFAMAGALLLDIIVKKDNVRGYLKYIVPVFILSNIGINVDVVCHIGGILGGICIMFILTSAENIVRNTSYVNKLMRKAYETKKIQDIRYNVSGNN